MFSDILQLVNTSFSIDTFDRDILEKWKSCNVRSSMNQNIHSTPLYLFERVLVRLFAGLWNFVINSLVVLRNILDPRKNCKF